MAPRAKRATPRARRITALGAGMRVLIAAADRDTVVTLGILLRSEGFEVRLAYRLSDVPNAVAEFQPHAALLAIPERSDYEVAADLNRRYGDACPVLIALTAHGSDEASGFDHRLPRRYDPDALLALLASLNSKRRDSPNGTP